ncbi:MAG: aminotransferase class I/II-fold pyridoxal phosphate-dependent enzyme [Oscillospiraceae bacterium]|nr:aminotransferase class I/II-fold pyridoxal phosphate-dependent enzyme [Oscillospiraceae bacterium]
MKAYRELTKQEREAELAACRAEFEEFKAKGLKLDMSRGKPGEDQLDLSQGMLGPLPGYTSPGGVDCRNYGGLEGIKEVKDIFSEILELRPEEVIVGGNSSLSLMYDNVAANMLHGAHGGAPWSKQGDVKFLCPVPGYDRHFSICEYLGVGMIPVPMTPDGPDMDTVEKLAATDPLIKGIWCVPVFSNPDGCVYSDETVLRFAGMKTAADDFRIYWDNAYCVHQFEGGRPVIPNIVRECEKAGHPHRPYVFASFSKVSFSGAGMAAMASSESNCEHIRQRLSMQTIGPDKLNHLRHYYFFKDSKGVYAHMEKMAELVRPKFKAVLDTLESGLGGLEVGKWNSPKGGYFVSFDAPDGCAKRTVALCKEAGVVMTGAGATYPYGKDPRDSNIRIAPTYPSVEQLTTAMQVFCLAIRIAALEQLTMNS